MAGSADEEPPVVPDGDAVDKLKDTRIVLHSGVEKTQRFSRQAIFINSNRYLSCHL